MTRSFFWVIVVLGCGGSSSPTPAAAVPSLDVPPLDASVPALHATAPKVDATCTTNEECVAVFTADDCCSQCRPRIANAAWKREIDAYCAKEESRTAKCEPTACSWGFSAPRCEKGLCK